MSKLLLDSSIIIDMIRRADKANALLVKLSRTNQHTFYASIIVHAEMYSGKSVWEKPQAKEELDTIFSGISILPLDKHLSENAGSLRAKYTMHLFDAIIAATAMQYAMPLVTLNIKDFNKIPDLQLFSKS